MKCPGGNKGNQLFLPELFPTTQFCVCYRPFLLILLSLFSNLFALKPLFVFAFEFSPPLPC